MSLTLTTRTLLSERNESLSVTSAGVPQLLDAFSPGGTCQAFEDVTFSVSENWNNPVPTSLSERVLSAWVAKRRRILIEPSSCTAYRISLRRTRAGYAGTPSGGGAALSAIGFAQSGSRAAHADGASAAQRRAAIMRW